jgi:hypothetical protein
VVNHDCTSCSDTGLDYRINGSTWYRLGTSSEKHQHDAHICAARRKGLEKHASIKEPFGVILLQSRRLGERASDM